MKQHIDVKQWEQLSEEQQQSIIPWLLGTGNLQQKHYSRYWNISKCIEFITQFHQIDMYTVDYVWNVQLFNLKDCPNDIGVSCIYEEGQNELIDVLFNSILWIINSSDDS